MSISRRQEWISSESKVLSFIAWILLLIGPLMALLARPGDRFVRFHATQSLVFGLSVIVLHVVLTTLSTYRILWKILWPLLVIVHPVLWLVWLIIAIVCGMRAYAGRWFKLPLVYHIAEKIG
ncbi:MAG: hypothetical protein DRJ63_03450, partial [Thermoprotei archaeon]